MCPCPAHAVQLLLGALAAIPVIGLGIYWLKTRLARKSNCCDGPEGHQH